MVRRENVRSVFSPGVRAARSVQQRPDTVTGVGSWGISAKARFAKGKAKGLRRRNPRKEMLPD